MSVGDIRGEAEARPDEEIVDQGLGFDLGTRMGRRQILRAFGLGTAALGLAACGNGSGNALGYRRFNVRLDGDGYLAR